MFILRQTTSLSKFSLLVKKYRQFSSVASPSLNSNEFYDLAINKLNRMSDVVLQKTNLHDDDPKRNMKETKQLLESIGITIDKLSKLKVIHVAGTKSKGITCVLTEQLLKSLGLKTGYYSSTHMFKVNERIRLNGMPISDDLFGHYFVKTFWPTMRWRAHEYGGEPPEYFNFLTTMAFHIFLEEQVDVAIVATGLGGKYDPTNLLPHTKTVGITPILFDNPNQLGNTLSEIAWHNSGIIKDKSNVFTVKQSPDCMKAIETMANNLNAKIKIVPNFKDYKVWNTPIKLKIANSVQHQNGSQAIQLAYNWLRCNKDNLPKQVLDKVAFLFSDPKYDCPTDVPKEFMTPFQTYYWPGRYQIINLANKTIYFDCGHSCESIRISTEWFETCTRENNKPKCLILNTTDDRDFVKLLTTIFDRLDQLDLIYFTPSFPHADNILENNNSQRTRGEYEGQLSQCYNLMHIWSNLRYSSINFNEAKIMTMPCIAACFEKLDDIYKHHQLDILVIGSVSLVGETLKYLNQNKLY